MREETNVRARVLVVDDEAINRKGFKSAIESFGYKVVAVGNGIDAVNEVREGHFDLVLMDCILPGVDGFEASRRIREHEKAGGRRTPIVALSGLAHDEDRQRCFDAGMDDFISKPIGMGPLLEMIKSWIAEAAPETEEIDDAGTPATRDVCNPTVLARHQRRGLLGEIVAVLRKDEPRRLARMNSSLESADSDRLADLAHGLAGVAGTLGAEFLLEAARKLEASARQGKIELCRDLIEDLTNKVEEVTRFLEDILEKAMEPG